MPVEVFKCGLVVYKREPVLACSLDGKVIDSGCSKPFGLLEVKCPETKFLVTPLDACSDNNFCCEIVDGKCKLKVTHPYYAQVQGQLGITGVGWCDFVVYTARCNYSNCSVIELNRTQSNLFERVGSISSIIEHNGTKKMCERVRLRSISELIEPNRT